MKTVSKPFQLTLDSETMSFLEYTYREIVGIILEYVSGGSTILALQKNKDNVVYSCETDSAWMARLMLYLSEQKLSHRIYPIHLDVGMTSVWGTPDIQTQQIDFDRMQKFVKCVQVPWRILGNHDKSPDFVLIDGRWRAACFLVTLLFCKKPTLILWDDYLERSAYHVFDDLLKPAEMIGRSALFHVNPRSYDAKDIISEYVHLFADWR